MARKTHEDSYDHQRGTSRLITCVWASRMRSEHRHAETHVVANAPRLLTLELDAGRCTEVTPPYWNSVGVGVVSSKLTALRGSADGLLVFHCGGDRNLTGL